MPWETRGSNASRENRLPTSLPTESGVNARSKGNFPHPPQPPTARRNPTLCSSWSSRHGSGIRKLALPASCVSVRNSSHAYPTMRLLASFTPDPVRVAAQRATLPRDQVLPDLAALATLRSQATVDRNCTSLTIPFIARRGLTGFAVSVRCKSVTLQAGGYHGWFDCRILAQERRFDEAGQSFDLTDH
ncbi:uncharacterized protein BJX67DRAFT_55043 [Aspergillus lucknowensis]|uniref:Uncharacterized protein n=1 Tax=Aspergillus lucknowensis TaxID=176173 RepID=A0ABR4LVD1_9EURO